MKKAFVLGVLGALFISGTVCSAGEPAGEAATGITLAEVRLAKEFPFNFHVQYWRSEGTALFRDVGFDPLVGPWESEVQYPLDGDFIVFGAEYAFETGRSRLSLDFNYGLSQDMDGTTKDWDWVWYDPMPLIYAETDTDADSDFLNANLYYRLWDWGPRNSVDVFLGYHKQEHSFTNTNGRVLIPEYFTAAGKVAEYEMDFRGVRAGVRMSIALSQRFSLKGNLAFIPYGDFDASGKWLLRDLSFSQSADGYGADLDVYLDFEIARNINLIAGVKYLYLRATDGEESGFAEGMPYGPYNVVDELESEQFGGTVGLLVKF